MLMYTGVYGTIRSRELGSSRARRECRALVELGHLRRMRARARWGVEPCQSAPSLLLCRSDRRNTSAAAHLSTTTTNGATLHIHGIIISTRTITATATTTSTLRLQLQLQLQPQLAAQQRLVDGSRLSAMEIRRVIPAR